MPVIRRSKVLVRRSRVRTPAVSDQYQSVCDNLQLIAKLDQEEAELTRRRKVVLEDIEESMKAGKLSHVDDGVLQATYQSTMGKSTRVVDPMKYRKAVGEKEFLASVTIQVTKAKEYLTEKELDNISKVTPAKEGPKVLAIKKVKRGK